MCSFTMGAQGGSARSQEDHRVTVFDDNRSTGMVVLAHKRINRVVVLDHKKSTGW
jgi:hypothetical protein